MIWKLNELTYFINSRCSLHILKSYSFKFIRCVPIAMTSILLHFVAQNHFPVSGKLGKVHVVTVSENPAHSCSPGLLQSLWISCNLFSGWKTVLIIIFKLIKIQCLQKTVWKHDKCDIALTLIVMCMFSRIYAVAKKLAKCLSRFVQIWESSGCQRVFVRR